MVSLGYHHRRNKYRKSLGHFAQEANKFLGEDDLDWSIVCLGYQVIHGPTKTTFDGDEGSFPPLCPLKWRCGYGKV